MSKIVQDIMSLLRSPELSEAEFVREQRKQDLVSALGSARSRLDTMHGLVRQEKPEDAELIARSLLVDLANLLPLLGEGDPVGTPAAAAQLLNESIQSQLADLLQEDKEAVEPSVDLVDSLFWMLRSRARQTITTELVTPLDSHEVKRRWQMGIVLGLLLAALAASFTMYQRTKDKRYRTQLDSMVAAVDVDQTQGYIREWIFSDTIDAPHSFGRNIDVDFLETAGGEPSILPTQGMTSRLIDDSMVVWNTIISPIDVIDVTKLLGHRDNAVVYAFTTIRSPYKRTATLFLGSDDGIKVWLNGEVVFQVSRMRTLRPDENRVQVTLQEGVNALLLKSTQDKGPWSLTCRIAAQTKGQVP